MGGDEGHERWISGHRHHLRVVDGLEELHRLGAGEAGGQQDDGEEALHFLGSGLSVMVFAGAE